MPLPKIFDVGTEPLGRFKLFDYNVQNKQGFVSGTVPVTANSTYCDTKLSGFIKIVFMRCFETINPPGTSEVREGLIAHPYLAASTIENSVSVSTTLESAGIQLMSKVATIWLDPPKKPNTLAVVFPVFLTS